MPNGLNRKASLLKSISKRKTAKIFVSRLLKLSLQKTVANLCQYLLSEVLCNNYQVCMTTSRKGVSPDLLQRLDQERSLKEHFQSARQENYVLCVKPKFTSKITLVISLHDLFPRDAMPWLLTRIAFH